GLQESRERLSALLFSQCWDGIYFAGCGSTYYLSLAAAHLHQQLTGQRTQAFPSSEIALFPAGVYPDVRQTVLLVAVSRSGETTETLQAAEEHRRRGLPVLAITCDADSRLAGLAEAAFVAQEAWEEAVPQTRSFTSMYLAAQFMAGLVANDQAFLRAVEQLPAPGRDVFRRGADLAGELASQNWRRAIFLGSGPYYGLACEGMLKLKEMALAWSEAYHFAEFRHGPISLVDAETLVVGMLSDTGLEAERAVLEDARRLGALTLALGEHPTPQEATYALALESGLPELARGVLLLLPLQLLAYERALLQGLDPQRPRHLRQVVVTP
ncbi:MAG: SIS domain-containing protein, partial [Anaerolineae bacterium]|nr:SIS domain-containing protein [Anaerolineae bacterium]